MSRTLQICRSGLNNPKSENGRKKWNKERKKIHVYGELVRSSNKISLAA